jgi:hypothetical protein
VTLRTGEAICRDCAGESCEIVQCDYCGEWLWAKDATKWDGEIQCEGCIERHIEELIDDNVVTLEEFLEEDMEDYADSEEGYGDYVSDKAITLRIPRRAKQLFIDKIKERNEAA